MSSTNTKNITLLILLVLVVTTTFIASIIIHNFNNPIYNDIKEIKDNE